MLSRRNIRVKVMQIYFAYEQDKDQSFKEAITSYRAFIKNSYGLLLYNLYLLLEVTSVAEEDYEKKKSKYITTKKDLDFKPRLHTNDLIVSLRKNAAFLSALKSHGITSSPDKDIIRKLYKDFSVTPEYQKYIEVNEDNPAADSEIILSLYKFLNKSEVFTEFLEDKFLTWEDDKSLVVGTMKKILKALPIGEDGVSMYEPDKETVIDFGEELLKDLYDSKEENDNLIQPVLKNWEMDRIAKMDMIILNMAICEFKGFPSVPTKVTLNEYVEISKNYSTDKSKEFVNGILDNLMKQLLAEGKIQKKGRGLIE